MVKKDSSILAKLLQINLLVFERFLLILNIHKFCNPLTKLETNILNGMKIGKMVLH